MPNTTTLDALVMDLRAEAMQSLNPLHGITTDENYRVLLQRVQRQLHLDFDWPHLRVDRDKTLAAGQRYYDFPTDLRLERVESVHMKWSGVWHSLIRGIEPDNLSAQDSDRDIRADPALRWQPYGTTQFEVWPVPASNGGVIRFGGIRDLAPLVNPGDYCELDRDLLVLYAAIEIVVDQKSPRAQSLAARAKAHYDKLKTKTEHNSDRRFSLGGAGARRSPRDRTPLVAVDRGN